MERRLEATYRWSTHSRAPARRFRLFPPDTRTHPNGRVGAPSLQKDIRPARNEKAVYLK